MEIVVFGIFPSNPFAITTRPPSSSLERWPDWFPLLRPVSRCRKRKSALLTAESAVRIASRAGSCTSRSRAASCSNGWLLIEMSQCRQGADEGDVIANPGEKQPEAEPEAVRFGHSRLRDTDQRRKRNEHEERADRLIFAADSPR